jgi:hypothetical protein
MRVVADAATLIFLDFCLCFYVGAGPVPARSRLLPNSVADKGGAAAIRDSFRKELNN